MHPLHEALAAAANGDFPLVDGVVEVHQPGTDGTQGIVEFTGHAVVLTERDPDEVRRRARDGFGGATDVDFVRWLAGPAGAVGTHDAVLVAGGAGRSSSLEARTDLENHPRVRRARRCRNDVRVYGNDSGFVTIGEGIVGRTELSVELLDGTSSTGNGRRLIRGALDLVELGGLVWAQVAPGNAASLRSFLACGFRPIGAERIVEPVR